MALLLIDSGLTVMLRSLFARYFFSVVAVLFLFGYSSLPAQAANIDSYIVKYLRVTQPIALDMDEQGNTREFSPQELSRGKQIFETNCMNCHVGGATLPNPQVSLSLETLKAANPPRNDIKSFVAFMRLPMTYDGSEETFWCRQLPESLLPQEDIENLAAFVLTAAQKAPGWGTQEF